MSGKGLLEDKLEKFDKSIFDFQNHCGLPVNKLPCSLDEIKDYLNLNKSHIDALSIDDCHLICIRLTQYTLFLQRTINTEKNKINFLNNEIMKTVARKVANYRGAWDVQKQCAIDDNEYASEAQETLLKITARHDSLQNITFSIKSLIEQINNVRYTKYNISKEK
jgi:hypothetical protein